MVKNLEGGIQIDVTSISSNPFSISSMEEQKEIRNDRQQKTLKLKVPRKLSFSEIVERERSSSPFGSDFPFSKPSTEFITFALNKCKTKRVILNVGGEKNEVLWSTLDSYPATRLGKLKHCATLEDLRDICDDYSLENNEYYFDRNPKSFSSILNFYRIGKLHIPPDACVVEFSNEMDYWEIDEMKLDACCHLKFQQKKDQFHHEADLKRTFDAGLVSLENGDGYSIRDFGDGCFSKYRKVIWDVFERPDYIPAKIMSSIIIFFIAISITTFTLSTMEEFQDISCKHLNKTSCADHLETLTAEGMESPVSHKEFIITKSYILVKLEQACMIFFTVEYLLRFICCPNKKKFLKSWHNFIDLVAIVPYYFSQILLLVDTPIKDLQLLLIFRVLRVFKIARHSNGLQSLGYTFRRCYNDLGVLLLFLSVGVIIFSSLAYFAEREVNKNFSSIPHAFWWVVVTMTTVGYGDVTPVSFFGKLVGCVTAVSGIIFCALPIAFTMNTFGEFYEKQRQRDKLIRRRKSLRWLIRN